MGRGHYDGGDDGHDGDAHDGEAITHLEADVVGEGSAVDENPPELVHATLSLQQQLCGILPRCIGSTISTPSNVLLSRRSLGACWTSSDLCTLGLLDFSGTRSDIIMMMT